MSSIIKSFECDGESQSLIEDEINLPKYIITNYGSYLKVITINLLLI
jgi:hypothetical protein